MLTGHHGVIYLNFMLARLELSVAPSATTEVLLKSSALFIKCITPFHKYKYHPLLNHRYFYVPTKFPSTHQEFYRRDLKNKAVLLNRFLFRYIRSDVLCYVHVYSNPSYIHNIKMCYSILNPLILPAKAFAPRCLWMAIYAMYRHITLNNTRYMYRFYYSVYI